MKKQTGIWINGSKAIIVSLEPGKERVTEIKSHIENRIYHVKEGNKGSFMGTQHLNNERKFEKKAKQQTSMYFKTVLENVKDADELYFFGPAETKIKLKNYLENNSSISKDTLKLVEASDKITTNQVVAKVKKFYNF